MILPLMLLSGICMAGERLDSIPERKAFGNLALSVDLTFMGSGISVATPISRSLSLRAGYWLIPFVSNTPMEGDIPNVAILPGGRSFAMPATSAKTSLQSHTARLLVDWVPFKKGQSVFYLTGGLTLQNRNTFRYDEYYDTEVFRNLGIDDIESVEVINEKGRYHLDGNGHVISGFYRPMFGMYVGLGVGRPIPKRKVGFRAEIGLPVYFGKAGAYADTIIEPHAESLIFLPFSIMSFPLKTYEVSGVFLMPSISLHLTIKLF